jgi:hypothetical protein
MQGQEEFVEKRFKKFVGCQGEEHLKSGVILFSGTGFFAGVLS